MRVAVVALLALAGCGLLPAASGRLVEACQSQISAGRYGPFADCIQNTNVATALQDGSASQLRAFAATARLAVASGQADDLRAMMATVEFANALSGNYSRDQNARMAASAALMQAGAAMQRSAQPQQIQVMPTTCMTTGNITTCR